MLSGAPEGVGSFLRGYNDGGTNIWLSSTPEQRLILCFDPWAKCENLDVTSVGETEFRRKWAQDAFQVVPQDNFLSGGVKNKPKFLQAILKANFNLCAG